MTLFKHSIFFCCLQLILPFVAFSQVQTIWQVKYERTENGIKSESGLSLIYYDKLVYLSRPQDKIQQFIDYRENAIVSILRFEEELYKNITSSGKLPLPDLGEQTAEILGYKCKYASYNYFSNKENLK